MEVGPANLEYTTASLEWWTFLKRVSIYMLNAVWNGWAAFQLFMLKY